MNCDLSTLEAASNQGHLLQCSTPLQRTNSAGVYTRYTIQTEFFFFAHFIHVMKPRIDANDKMIKKKKIVHDISFKWCPSNLGWKLHHHRLLMCGFRSWQEASLLVSERWCDADIWCLIRGMTLTEKKKKKRKEKNTLLLKYPHGKFTRDLFPLCWLCTHEWAQQLSDCSSSSDLMNIFKKRTLEQLVS